MGILRVNKTGPKPILKWAGGKAKLISQLEPHFPGQCDTYLEPFLGGGAVFFSLSGYKKAHINDANPEIINLYKVARDEPDSLLEAVLTFQSQYGESFYYSLRAKSPTCPIECAARTLFLNKTGFNGLYRQNSQGGFNVPFGKRKSCPQILSPENLKLITCSLKGVELTCLDFEDLLNLAGQGDFVYCDPPYEPISPTSSFNAYRQGGFSQSEQRRLYQACLAAKDRGAHILVSNSAAPFIRNLYVEENTHLIKAKRAINSKGDSRGSVDELLAVFSEHHPLPSNSHDSRIAP